ncbi:MAG: hypothetical protein ACFCGT_05780 [Sandaracinaceae bacterium]
MPLRSLHGTADHRRGRLRPKREERPEDGGREEVPVRLPVQALFESDGHRAIVLVHDRGFTEMNIVITQAM